MYPNSYIAVILIKNFWNAWLHAAWVHFQGSAMHSGYSKYFDNDDDDNDNDNDNDADYYNDADEDIDDGDAESL